MYIKRCLIQIHEYILISKVQLQQYVKAVTINKSPRIMYTVFICI